jgi:hypothetical protein
MSATLTMFNTRQIMPAIQNYPSRATKVRYKIVVAGCDKPWADAMRPYMQRLLGTNSLGAKTLELFTAALAKSASHTYGSATKPYFEFCEERKGLTPMAATAASMACYIDGSGNEAPSRQRVCNLTSHM